MKFIYISIQYIYRYFFEKHKIHLSRWFCCIRTCNCVNIVSVTSASRSHPRHQIRSSMYSRGLIPRNFAELAEAVPIAN